VIWVWGKIFLLLVLTEILSAYGKLKDTASEHDLRNFLSSFKDHAPQVKFNLRSVTSVPWLRSSCKRSVVWQSSVTLHDNSKHAIFTMNCCKPLLTGIEKTSRGGQRYHHCSCNCRPFFSVFLHKQNWYLKCIVVRVIKLTPCFFSTPFIQLSDALEFLQSHNHEDEQGNTIVKRG